MAIPYYLIVNIGTMIGSKYARSYPRHLVLAQQWLHSGEYRDALTAARAQYGTRIILDNGAHEGIDIDPLEYLRITEEIGPDVVVLTDLVGRPSEISRERAMSFARQVEKYVGFAKLMYAPQGEDRDEIIRDYEWAQSTLDPNKYIIGVGQSYLRWETVYCIDEMARYDMLKEVMALKNAKRLRYHILGARWRSTTAFDEWKDRIVGLDTIKPCTCALANTIYPVKPKDPIDRFSMDVADDMKLIKNVVRLSERYELDIA